MYELIDSIRKNNSTCPLFFFVTIFGLKTNSLTHNDISFGFFSKKTLYENLNLNKLVIQLVMIIRNLNGYTGHRERERERERLPKQMITCPVLW